MRRVEVTVLDEDAIPLTRAIATSDEASDRVQLDELSVPGALLDYYFGRGERTIMLQGEDTLTIGTVETTWEHSERRWEVWLEASTEDLSLVPTEPGTSTELPTGRRPFR